ncbi:ORF_4 [Adoxophyes orana granulovirus]|uniref:ADOR4 n=1 Tax=Adoxophyes orana granulovirus TaxID=170617 RepID=Q91B71_GVAO|nr:ORF_4 [Adoxophyes orana granulovirus]AAL02085.1 unknown [Adoxophyes orana granulovirus]AAP85641.1 ORF_4 [Adoxophyes orana granulovirus]AJA91644.1 ADOR4 [Adoxophyes orana granulovirus]
MFLSIVFDEHQVYYNYYDSLQITLLYQLENFDKRSIENNRLKIVNRNTQVYNTDGNVIALKLLCSDSCFVSLVGILELIDLNVFGDKLGAEKYFYTCTIKVLLDGTHPWRLLYYQRIDKHLHDSFNFYFNILKHYMLMGQPNADIIEHHIKLYMAHADEFKMAQCLLTRYKAIECYDNATALILHQIKHFD